MADNKKNKHKNWQIKRRRIKYRIRQKNRNDYPRLVVYRSNSNIYAQLVDDLKMTTLLSASSIDKDLKDPIKKAANKIEKSKIVGVAIAEKIKNDISNKYGPTVTVSGNDLRKMFNLKKFSRLMINLYLIIFRIIQGHSTPFNSFQIEMVRNNGSLWIIIYPYPRLYFPIHNRCVHLG